jgi:biopolymer transport protein ExbB
MAVAATRQGAEDGQSEADDAEIAVAIEASKINLLELLVRGGWLMVPIAAMSLLVVAFGAERLLGLRRRRILPSRLMTEIRKMARHEGAFDPRRAYQLTMRYPSSAARVIRAMLLKVGRPHSEVERAISEASEREAARLYSNVRWLSLAAGITPLLGLLGTVWGMIDAFFRTSELPVGANKAEFLAGGIYKALVTTFAGLAVAIPAAILAHYFEGRIQKLLHRLDETLLELLPRLERYEGRLRVTEAQLDGSDPRPLRETADGQPRKRRPAAAPK